MCMPLSADGAQRQHAITLSLVTHVYVEPDVVLLAYVGDLRDGVEGAVDGGAGGGVDEEGQVPLALVEHHQLLQLLWNHATPEMMVFLHSFTFPLLSHPVKNLSYALAMTKRKHHCQPRLCGKLLSRSLECRCQDSADIAFGSSRVGVDIEYGL